ncbi:cation:proton antiporter [uncultured Prevotellamassilia sp.]|uniref:cation:proton antiporter n=1 Tax=uncultured Prevotellamassilia sp. TaxID=1926676 RepID=UPI002587C78B|nr:cation:proton antiporter [uncultured Prevotellamassilia sp.]
MESFISDLALILISASLVTLVFKRLKQPLVLGYIVAGFLAGPHMPYTPSVSDMSSIHTWADIGVIFLMFTLGLEFSFKKIVKMGIGPVIAACSVMFCMMSVGNMVGHLFGWGSMNSLFLGGMLAMSSTTIIYKAFDDLGLRQQKFAGEVLSVLILEDILGILLMVVLSALAVSRQFQGMELVGSLFKLGFFLILWFVVGVYIIPIFLRRTHRFMNKETLLVVSIGLCFLLVVIAGKVGYSSAFGAFMMGSILAETVEAEKIERVVSPVKDLFGAIFFVSVGMLVDPAVLAAYWLPIVVLCIAIIVGQAVFGTTSFLLSGQPLRIAVQGGFSLAQIGEFAFIIASLGISLGVTSDFLYPVVVAVSIITTFFTPYMIRAAQPVCRLLERVVPQNVMHRLMERGTHAEAQSAVAATDGVWKRLLMALVSQVGAYLTLSVAVILISFTVLLPLCRGALGHWPGNVACGLLTVLVASPFLRAIVMRKNHSDEWKQLRSRSRMNHVGLWVTFGVRYALATAAIYYVINFLSPFWWVWNTLASVLIVALIIASRRVKWVSIKMERVFLQNLRSREVMAQSNTAGEPGYAGRLNSRNIHIAELEVPEDSAWGGCHLRHLGFSHHDGVMIAAIVRGSHRINVPDGDTMIFPGDRIEAIGSDESLQLFQQRMNHELAVLPQTASKLLLRRLLVREGSPLIGTALRDSGIRSAYHCMAVGFEDADGNIEPATAERVIVRHDAIWVVGEDDSLHTLLHSMLPPKSAQNTK